MRNSLVAAIEDLHTHTERNLEVRISIIRAFNYVERIGLIEENPFSTERQGILGRCLPQIT